MQNNSKNSSLLNAQNLMYAAMCIALGFATSNIKLVDMPMGGSVTPFSMFFICFAGYLFGPVTGIITSIAYGALQLIVDPYILSPLQVVCDYFLAFGALGLCGFFRKLPHGLQIGYLVSITGRFFFSVISGVVFFAEYAPEGMNPVVYSVLYNGAYIYAEGLLTMALMAVPAVRQAIREVRQATA